MDPENKIVSLNELGLKTLESNPTHSLLYLNQALLESRCLKRSQIKQKLLAMTYNSLGCYYKTTNHTDKALEYFQKSAILGRTKNFDEQTLAYAHLNIAGLISLKNQPENALRHALKSIKILKTKDLQTKNITTLISAHELMASEYSKLDQKNDCKLSLQSALELCYKHLGKNHIKTLEIKTTLDKILIEKPKLLSSRAGSVMPNRNYTPSNVNNRMLKNRLINYMEKVRNKTVDGNCRPVSQGRIRGLRTGMLKNIDMNYVRNLENFAAVRIQAWWRGVLCRKFTHDMIILRTIEKEEDRAKGAYEKIERLKQKLKVRNGSKFMTMSRESSPEKRYRAFLVDKQPIEVYYSKKVVCGL
ncbi:hypothetical protein SteCoe_19945 [Stentor coeruleus]|uniref:Uncharacterized protein n=1 Tax=Stentor coeruleus TaxID=5963 RepID=A0A1R2BTK9_9CILI|nr:hypothetical protein SteCoe_19945 [Stentor coeruleus]